MNDISRRPRWRSWPALRSLYFWTVARLDDAIALVVRARRARDRGDRLPTVVAPVGRGNIGDQAMMDSLLEAVPGRLNVVVEGTDSVSMSDADRHRTTVHVLPGAFRLAVSARRVADVAALARVLASSSVLLVPGADTMHGPDARSSLARHEMLSMALRLRTPALLQGFSWAPGVEPRYLRSLRRLSRRGARLLPRDPVSLRRLAHAGVEVEQAADVVFGSRTRGALPDDITGWLDAARAQQRHVAVVNASGLIALRHDLHQDLREVVARLHDLGSAVCFLPHVMRDPDDDLPVCRLLHRESGSSDDLLVTQLLTPAQVRTLASQADLVLTGRMHLAILSLSESTPAVTLATEGKVEGLYELMGLPQLVVEPAPGCAAAIMAAVDVLERNAGVRSQIASRLPAVRELSRKNVPTALGEPAPTTR